MEYEPRDPPDHVNVTPTHPLRELATLLVGVVAVTGVVLVAAGFALDVGLQHLPPRYEVRLFERMWSPFTEAPSEPEHPRAAEARALLLRLAAHWPDNPYALRLEVADVDAPNAFAVPGGLVVVTRGLLDDLETENELAFVLGHELGHFQGRHHLRGLGRTLVLRLGLATVLGGSAGESLPALLADLTDRGFARDHEREADRFGLELVDREYGHVAGADAFFRKLPDAEAGLGERLGSWVASHPVSEDRIDDLSALARERGYETRGAQVPLAPLPEPPEGEAGAASPEPDPGA